MMMVRRTTNQNEHGNEPEDILLNTLHKILP